MRPGGVLLVEEDDGYPVLTTATGAYREAWEVFIETMASGGTEPGWAPCRNLPERPDRGREVLEDPARWFHGPAMIAAWGRRPRGG